MGKARVLNSRQGKTFCTPPFKEWELFAPPPIKYGLNLKLLCKNYPKTCFATPPPPLSARLNPPAALFVGVKLHMHPPLPFCSPHLPVISDQSLSTDI